MGHQPTGFCCNLRRKLISHKSYAKCIYFCPIASNQIFCWTAPTSSIYFLTTSTYRLGAVVSLKISTTEKGHNSPHSLFGSTCLLWPNGWMEHDTTWYEDRPRPRRHCVIWGLSSSDAKGHSSPHFSAHCSGPHPRRPAFYP